VVAGGMQGKPLAMYVEVIVLTTTIEYRVLASSKNTNTSPSLMIHSIFSFSLHYNRNN